jgi:hypothetical protein
MIAIPDNRAETNQARPLWIDDSLIAETKIVWEPMYGHGLTDGEVLEILLNVGRLIDAIQEQ